MKPRPIKPNEIPAFGSVWQWKDTPGRFVAISLIPPPETATAGSIIKLQAFRMPDQAVDVMAWGYVGPEGLVTLDDWACLMEGPKVSTVADWWPES